MVSRSCYCELASFCLQLHFLVRKALPGTRVRRDDVRTWDDKFHVSVGHGRALDARDSATSFQVFLLVFWDSGQDEV